MSQGWKGGWHNQGVTCGCVLRMGWAADWRVGWLAGSARRRGCCVSPLPPPLLPTALFPSLSSFPSSFSPFLPRLQVFFIRDGMQFPDMVHSLKPNPKSHIQEGWRIADFFSHHPEAMHMVGAGGWLWAGGCEGGWVGGWVGC